MVAAALGALLAATLALPGVDFLPRTCPFLLLTGLPCATCGMTRAFFALGHGRLGEALSLNHAAPLVYGLAWTTLVLAFAQAALGVPLLDRARARWGSWVVGALVMALGASWVAKVAASHAPGAATPSETAT